MIGDERRVAMALAPRDLVDRDFKQVAEAVPIEQFVADALDDPPDRLPVDPRQPAGRRLVGLGRQPRDEILEVAGKARAAPGERDALDVHVVLRTAQPPQPGVNLQAPAAEIQMAPDRVVMLLVLAMARGVRALRATQTADLGSSVAAVNRRGAGCATAATPCIPITASLGCVSLLIREPLKQR